MRRRIYIQNRHTNNITVNITVYWGNVGPFVGGINLSASQTQFLGIYTYSQLTNALRNSRTTVTDSNAVASLPANDSITTNKWYVVCGEVKALGLPFATPNDLNLDGEIGFATNVSYTFDATNRAVVGKFDFIGVVLHKMTDVMGRNTFGLVGPFIP